jgi:hypothetical protein
MYSKLLLSRRLRSQQPKKLDKFSVLAFACVVVGSVKLAFVDQGAIYSAFGEDYGELHAITVEARLAVADGNALPVMYRVNCILILVLASATAYLTVRVVRSFVPIDSKAMKDSHAA